MATLALPRLSSRRPSRALLVAGVLALWLVGWLFLRGRQTLSLAESELTPLHRFLNAVNNSVGASRNSNPVFRYFFNEIRLAVDQVVTIVQLLIAQPGFGRPVPVIGWLGVVAIVAFVAATMANSRIALIATAGFVFLGLQGLWQESMDTLALTLSAVLIALLFGIPLGVWAGQSDRIHRLVTPVLDFMQTMPTFVYLAPLTLFFLIGPASATIATLIYAMPPAVRITAHAIRSVPATTVEAATSLGSTRTQILTKVLLPTAKRTIVLGVNQTIMAALSMVTIAALIDAPGLGKTVVRALETLDVGTAFNAGLAIVVMAIVLDRTTTAVSARAERARGHPSMRRPTLIVGGLLTVVAVWLSHTYVWAAEFPDRVSIGGHGVNLGIGSAIARAVTAATDWAQHDLSGITNAVKNAVSAWLIDPLQELLTQSPWWLVAVVIVALATVAGNVRAALTAAACLALLVASGLWQATMITFAATLVATVVAMLFGIAVGVWMGRNTHADRIIRPLLDACQTMPSFVYLVPFLALFAASRFTAIVAAVVFAAPVVIKIVAEGVRGVPDATVEAATAAGSNTWQVIVKVQLPVARRALLLATNQGLIYVLSMVVVGGLVGAGALGYDVVAGFSQSTLYGKGLAAGAAIVLLGIMLDRITQAAANRSAHGTARP